MEPTMCKLILGATMAVALVQAVEAANIGGGRSLGMSRPTYSPARSSNAGAAAKPAPTHTPPPAKHQAGPPDAAPMPTPAGGSHQHSTGGGGSFWTPFILGYMSSSSSSSKAATPASSGKSNFSTTDATMPLEAAPPENPMKTEQAGPFSINIPGRELLDNNCRVVSAAKDFITASKIPNSVLFLTLPPSGRCEQVRDRLRADLRPAILVRSEIGQVQLIRIVGSAAGQR